jgi:hypothetical protein
MVPLDEQHEQGVHLFMPVDESQEVSRISLGEELQYRIGIISFMTKLMLALSGIH